MYVIRIACFLCILVSQSVIATESTCAPKEYSPEQLLDAALISTKVGKLLNTFREDTALISRQGEELSAYGKSYAHMAFAVRKDQGWVIIHKHADCTGRAGILVTQSLLQFTADAKPKSSVVIYRIDRKQALSIKKTLLEQPQSQLSSSVFSLVQYPFSSQYQSPSGWVLETWAAVLSPTKISSRTQAQAWLQSQGFQPGITDVSWVRRLPSWPTKPYLGFEDHPNDERWSGQFSTVTENSIIMFLKTQPQACLEPNCDGHIVNALP